MFKKSKKIIALVLCIALVPSPAHAGWFDGFWNMVKDNCGKITGFFAAAATAASAFLGYKLWRTTHHNKTLREQLANNPASQAVTAHQSVATQTESTVDSQPQAERRHAEEHTSAAPGDSKAAQENYALRNKLAEYKTLTQDLMVRNGDLASQKNGAFARSEQAEAHNRSLQEINRATKAENEKLIVEQRLDELASNLAAQAMTESLQELNNEQSSASSAKIITNPAHRGAMATAQEEKKIQEETVSALDIDAMANTKIIEMQTIIDEIAAFKPSGIITVDEQKITAFNKRIEQLTYEINPILVRTNNTELLQYLEATYAENFKNVKIEPTTAYDFLQLSTNASIDQIKSRIITLNNGKETNLNVLRQVQYVFGYPYCNAVAKENYDFYCAHKKGITMNIKMPQADILKKLAEMQTALQNAKFTIADHENLINCQRTQGQKLLTTAFANYNHQDEKVRAEALKSAAAVIGLQKHHYAGPMAFSQLVLENYAKLEQLCANNEKLQNTLHDFNATAPWSKGEKQLKNLHDTKSSEESKRNDSFEEIQTLTIDQIIDIVWYLYACAVKKGQAFQDGTFTIESKPLFNALMMHLQNPNKGRISSHFKEVGVVGQYGIDIPHSHATALSFPNNKYHILFGDISSDKYIQKTGRLLFFLKPESAGIASVNDFVHHSGEFLISVFKKTAPTAVIQGVGFKTDDDPAYAKERVENAILEKVKTYAKLINNTTIVSEVKNHGIKAFADFIKKEENQPKNEQQRTVFTELMALINHYDYNELRKGREVILTAQELGVTAPSSAMASSSSSSSTTAITPAPAPQTRALAVVALTAASPSSVTSSTADKKE